MYFRKDCVKNDFIEVDGCGVRECFVGAGSSQSEFVLCIYLVWHECVVHSPCESLVVQPSYV